MDNANETFDKYKTQILDKIDYTRVEYYPICSTICSTISGGLEAGILLSYIIQIYTVRAYLLRTGKAITGQEIYLPIEGVSKKLSISKHIIKRAQGLLIFRGLIEMVDDDYCRLNFARLLELIENHHKKDELIRADFRKKHLLNLKKAKLQNYYEI